MSKDIDVFMFELTNYPSFCPLRKGVLLVNLDEICQRHKILGLCKRCKDFTVDTLIR